MEGSTFRKTPAAARSVFRIKKTEVRSESGATAPTRWEAVFGRVLKVLSRYPEAYGAVTIALKEMEASP